MSRLARFLDAAADMWRQFTAAMGWPSAAPDPGTEEPVHRVPAVHEDAATTGPDLDDCHRTSLLDRVFPLDLCDFEHADRVHRAYVRAAS